MTNAHAKQLKSGKTASFWYNQYMENEKYVKRAFYLSLIRLGLFNIKDLIQLYKSTFK